MSGKKTNGIITAFLTAVIAIELFFVAKAFWGPSFSKRGFDMTLITHWAMQEIREATVTLNPEIDINSIEFKKLAIVTNADGDETITVRVENGETGEITMWEMNSSDKYFNRHDISEDVKK